MKHRHLTCLSIASKADSDPPYTLIALLGESNPFKSELSLESPPPAAAENVDVIRFASAAKGDAGEEDGDVLRGEAGAEPDVWRFSGRSER
jgi:hypothetical protein